MSLKACNITKSNTPSWVFLTFFILYKWYQIAQRITYRCTAEIGWFLLEFSKQKNLQYFSFYYRKIQDKTAKIRSILSKLRLLSKMYTNKILIYQLKHTVVELLEKTILLDSVITQYSAGGVKMFCLVPHVYCHQKSYQYWRRKHYSAANPDVFWYRVCGMGAQKNPPK